MRLIGKLGWLLRFAGAVVAGALWRLLRRLARRPPRIWHGHRPVHMTRDMVRADRLAGFPSRSVADRASVLGYALLTESDFDLVIAGEGVADDTLHWRAMIDLHLHGDIWTAYFDCLFYPASQHRRNLTALRIIRAAGIRVVVMPHGSDVVQLHPAKTRYDWIGRMQLDYPAWDFAEQTPVSRERIELFTRFASFIIAGEPSTARLLDRADLLFKYFPVEIPATPAFPSTNVAVPAIVHAPNHRHVKGTDLLLAAIEQVRAAGFACELQMIERVPRTVALEMYRAADIVADQFIIGAYGVFALETLALGKPVLTYLDEEHLAAPQLNVPLVNATPDNLVRVLAVLIAVPELRRRLGEAGRVAVERWQSIEALAEVWRAVYRHVWWGEPLRLETTRAFEPARPARALTEDPRDAAFWPVPVEDLLPRIEDVLSRV